jgi:hypothetical protein
MPIPVADANTLLADLGSDQISVLLAQAHAKHVLQEVKEVPENYPAFDPLLDDKVTFVAYAQLAAGCSIIEQGDRAAGRLVIERAASLLHYAHSPNVGTGLAHGFHALVAGMAFYAAGHYSRAFVAVRATEEQTDAARVIAAFLRKDLRLLIERLNDVILRDPPAVVDYRQLDEWAITTAIARAIAQAAEFMFSGGEDALERADETLRHGLAIAATQDSPAWWWILRLLRLMLSDLRDSSPWNVLPPYFAPDAHATLRRYIQLLAFARHPIVELWTSQRTALPLALDERNRGAVINLRTSAGKTRIAELAILRALVLDPTARIFYLAPFRSLAIEVEQSLSATLSWLGYGVSHLYGGSRVSSVDTQLAAESAITIATPEKARALLRASPELFANLKLVIVDEGHLIGAQERYIRNEVFMDHLRALVHKSGARLLLLSAVLPNPHELAAWVAGDAAAVATSAWKPSEERFGLLRWNGSRARIDWKGETPSFNPYFVEAKPLGFGRRRKPFPSDKTEAVAAAAVRLSTIGPVMIFTGMAVSVPPLARAVLTALGEYPTDYLWPEHEWRVFEAVCREELEPDALELRAARAGVICHSSRLTPQVRLAIEHLMRSRPPRIIVATTTLAQGVNIGISSVIVSSPYIGKNITIGKRDFWNICGRAGRAFVDGEGKILYAIDDSRARWQVERDEELAEGYFATGAGENVKSGLLAAIRYIRRKSEEAGVSFDLLLEMAANNDFSALGEPKPPVAWICDLLDDELLAMHLDPLINSTGNADRWMEEVFRQSLAVLQGDARAANDVLAFLKARVRYILHRVPVFARTAVVSSGLPLTVAIRAHESLDVFRTIADTYANGQPKDAALGIAVREVERWTRQYAQSLTESIPPEDVLDLIRPGWLAGYTLEELSRVTHETRDIAREFYGYELPWIVHAAAQQLRGAGDSERADALESVALLVELGVPTDLAAMIFLAGVRSRAAATELARVETAWGEGVAGVSRRLRNADFVASLTPQVSENARVWLDLFINDADRRTPRPLPSQPPFALPDAGGTQLLHARIHQGHLLFASTDGQTRLPVAPAQKPRIRNLVNDPRVAFVPSQGHWVQDIRDPRLLPEPEPA